MAFEYRVRFQDSPWYAANRQRLAAYIRTLPRLKNEISPEEFRLKDDVVENSWPYDLRVFLRDDRVDVEVSATTATLDVDMRAILRWLRDRTDIEFLDEDGLPGPL